MYTDLARPCCNNLFFPFDDAQMRTFKLTGDKKKPLKINKLSNNKI